MSKRNLKSEYVKYLNQFSDESFRQLGIDCIIVFGSYGTNSATKHSDLDLCIIADFDENAPPWERIKQVKPMVQINGVYEGDVICLRPNEALYQLEKGKGIILSIVDDGEVVYEGTPIFKDMKRKFEKLEERGLVKTKLGYKYTN